MNAKIVSYLWPMLTETTTELTRAIAMLQTGGILAIPTETVYGLAANALDAHAVSEIYRIKQRPVNHPLILHFGKLNDVLPYVSEFPEDAERLASHFWPGPLTLLLKKTEKVPGYLTGASPFVGVRIPAHPLLLNLLNQISFPLAAPSANPYGMVSPTEVSHVVHQLGGKIPLILDGGPCCEGIESTIIGFQEDKAIVYRLGSLELDDIATVLGYIPEIVHGSTEKPLTSGMVKFHYATQTPLYFMDEFPLYEADAVYLFLFEIPSGFEGLNSRILSENKSLKEVARNLYAFLHTADASGAPKIYIERPPNEGIGRSILDRLQRATAKFRA
jgi:L-threonylcarbamoyladenylate synthase